MIDAKAEEAAYVEGARWAWILMLQQCLINLGESERPKYAWVLERQRAISALRKLCSEHGDNEWPDDLDLEDVITKHLHIGSPDIPAGYQFWRIDAFLQKNHIDICRWEFDKDLEEKITFFNFYSPKIVMYCFAKNKTHAKKIFSKKKADLILSGEWDKLCLGKI